MNSKTAVNQLISIIIPVYNRESIIEATLDSILHQSYYKWECIIVDDGSTDNTRKLVRNFATKDSRFQLYDRPKSIRFGGNGARNHGFDLSVGAYIQFLDSDDLLAPMKLEIQIKDLLVNPSINYSVCENNIFINSPLDSDSNWFGSKADAQNRLDSYLRKKLGIQTASPLFKREFLEKIKYDSGLFNEDLRQSQEWEFFCRILYSDPNYLYNPQVLLYIRDNRNSITSEYLKSNPVSIGSQIKALELVYNYLKDRDYITRDLNNYFINSGVTIMKKILDKRFDEFLKGSCDRYLLNCLPDNFNSKIYKLRYQFGKFLWNYFHHGHFLLKY
jgi:glycosyltransferase involved in cell wall biosynthesis